MEKKLFEFGGRKVSIPPVAEMARSYRAAATNPGRIHDLIQDALNEAYDDSCENPHDYVWANGTVVPFTLELEQDEEPLPQYVVDRQSDDEVLRGLYRLHTARSPQPVPFVLRGKPEPAMSLTIELVRSRGRMLLVRVYGGEYVPLLPWQASVGNYEGGKAASEEFWRTHAFVTAREIIGASNLSPHSPTWARAVAHV